jgi:hypothetical protein
MPYFFKKFADFPNQFICFSYIEKETLSQINAEVKSKCLMDMDTVEVVAMVAVTAEVSS